MHSNDRREHKENVGEQEIDIFDLLLQIWKGKKIILCTVVFALIIASAWLIFHKPKWISTAVVSLPETGQVADYTNTLMLLYPASESKGSESNAFLPSISDIRSGVYGRFSAQLSARVNQDAFKNILKMEALQLAQQQLGSTPAPIKLEYTADVPDRTGSELRAFIEQTSQDVQHQLVSDLKNSIAQRKEVLKQTLAIQEKLAVEQRAQRLDLLNEVKSARQEVTTTEGLSVVIKSDSDRQLNYGDEYLRTQEQLLRLESIVPEKMKIDAFSWVVEPTAPQEDNANMRIIIVLLAMMLGIIAGVVIILTRNALQRYHQR